MVREMLIVDRASSSPETTPENFTLPGLTSLGIHGTKSFGAEEAYELEEILGEGSYGCVYRCRRTRDDATFAVKIIDPVRLGFVGGEHAIRSAEALAVREVNALRQLAAHPGVISLEAAFYSNATRQIFIVSDYVPGGHLFSHVVSRGSPFQEGEVSHVVAQVSDALRFCHSLGLVHRDLKLENVLVANIGLTLQQFKAPDTERTMWQTMEVIAVKICDFGFAKSLQEFTTRTPIGTATYAAPEVNLALSVETRANGSNKHIEADYDAFKADAYSLGLMIFVMLCLAFPEKDGNRYSHRSNKLWPSLSGAAQSLIDGLLEVDPIKRLSLINVCQHRWVNLIEVDSVEGSKQAASKAPVDEVAYVSEFEVDADTDQGFARQTTVGIPRCVDEPVLRGVLALHRLLVHVQQERSMALWALAGSPGVAGISCSRDQLQWHIDLTEKRVHEAKKMLEQGQSMGVRTHLDETFQQLAASLMAGRQLSLSVVPLGMTDRPSSCMSLDSFDALFAAYNDACTSIIETVARCVERVKRGSSEGRRAARRYRLFSTAAEQLSRERAFMCGQSPSDSVASCKVEELPSAMLQRLFEIIGARKILLGTAKKGSYTVASSTGLLGVLIGEGQPSLLSAADVAELEYLEARVLAPTKGEALPIAEWYQTLSRQLNQIHSSIAISLAHDVRTPTGLGALLYQGLGALEAGPVAQPPSPKRKPALEPVAESMPLTQIRGERRADRCGCKAGLQIVLLRWLDMLEK